MGLEEVAERSLELEAGEDSQIVMEIEDEISRTLVVPADREIDVDRLEKLVRGKSDEIKRVFGKAKVLNSAFTIKEVVSMAEVIMNNIDERRERNKGSR